jgi:hypothetical protein
MNTQVLPKQYQFLFQRHEQEPHPGFTCTNNKGMTDLLVEGKVYTGTVLRKYDEDWLYVMCETGEYASFLLNRFQKVQS